MKTRNIKRQRWLGITTNESHNHDVDHPIQRVDDVSGPDLKFYHIYGRSFSTVPQACHNHRWLHGTENKVCAECGLNVPINGKAPEQPIVRFYLFRRTKTAVYIMPLWANRLKGGQGQTVRIPRPQFDASWQMLLDRECMSKADFARETTLNAPDWPQLAKCLTKKPISEREALRRLSQEYDMNNYGRARIRHYQAVYDHIESLVTD